MDYLYALLPIGGSFLLGVLAGRLLNPKIRYALTRCIGPFIWVLLFAIGYQFGLTLENLVPLGDILTKAFSFSLGTSLLIGIGIYLLYDRHHQALTHHAVQDIGIRHVIQECAWAILSIIIGILFVQTLIFFKLNTSFFPSTDVFLYILLVLIGIDISQTAFSFKSLTPKLIWIPLVIVGFSSLGGVLVALLFQMDWRYGLLFSAGFGWFSLSGVMVTAHLGEYYGAISLLTDLYRELFCIVVLFFWGRNYPQASISIAGATAMDTTLPIIKKSAGSTFLPHAFYIGFTLSLIAPFYLALLLSLF